MSDLSRARSLARVMARTLGREIHPDADATAAALLFGGAQALRHRQLPHALGADIMTLLASSAHPDARVLLRCFDLIPWGVNPVAANAGAGADIYLVANCLGPDAPVMCPNYRAGFFYQKPGTYYALHSHMAEETYTVLAGEAEWTAGSDIRPRRAGSIVHHPSFMPHAFRAGPRGLFAMWRWAGDISTESYAMLDDPAAAQPVFA